MTTLDYLRRWCVGLFASRQPDFIIGHGYLSRWYVKRDYESCFYVHEIVGDDDDRALHDHPWDNLSFIVRGVLREILPTGSRTLHPGDSVFRFAEQAHRLEVVDPPVWTLFFTGPRRREWGFHCPQGWRHWRDFVNPEDTGQPGRGCD